MDYKLLNPPVATTPSQPPDILSLYTNPNSKVDANASKQSQNTPSIHKQYGSLFKIAVISTILFILLSHHMTYTVFNQIYAVFTKNNNYFMSSEGCPTMNGILSNAAIFFVTLLVMLYY